MLYSCIGMATVGVKGLMTDSGRAVKERVAICYQCKWRADRIEGGHKTRARYRIIRFRVRLITTSHDGADVVQAYYIL